MSGEIIGRYYVRRREFLNEDPELPAFIIGIVEDTRAVPDDDSEVWANGDITLDLADCNRRVSFYFNMYDTAERANSLRKINIIAEVVNAVRDAIDSEVASRNARPAKRKPVTTEAASPEAIEVVHPKPLEAEPARPVSVFTSHIITLGL
jgi:hypothetical protein